MTYASPSRHSTAAVLELLAAPAWARLVTPNFGHISTHRAEIELKFRAFSIFRTPTRRFGRWSICGWRARRIFAQEKLRQRGKKVLERLQV